MYSAIVLAAGTGSRMGLGYNKMLYPLQGIPVMVRTVQKFKDDPACRQIIVVTDDITKASQLLDGVQIVNGGKERQDSVYKGLLNVTEKLVLVHDGARPFVSQSMIDSLVEVASSGMAAIVGVPVKDTIKRLRPDKSVLETLKRDELYAVQTPQAAPAELLRMVHEHAQKVGFLGTDEASLIEKFSQVPVQIVEGAYTNIKLTTPEDLLLAERLLQEGL